MRSLVLGFLAGQALAALRAPLGVDLFQLPALSASTAYGFRAGALALIGLGLLAAGRRLALRPGPGMLALGAVLGFVHRGLLFEADPAGLALLVAGWMVLFTLSGWRLPRAQRAQGPLRGMAVGALSAAMAVWSETTRGPALVGYGVIWFVAAFVLPRSRWLFPDADEDGDSGEMLMPRGEASGLALAGAGAAIALEGLARHLRLLGGGLAQDDALFGGLLLLFAALGAGAFRGSLAGARARELARGPALAVLALGAFAGMRAIGSLGSPIGLERYLRGMGSVGPLDLDPSLHGTLIYDLAIALPVLALPGLLLGAALRALRGPVEIGAALFGAAAGHVLVPALMAVEVDGAELVASQASASLVGTGAKIAALGGLVAAGLGAARRGRGGPVAALVAVACGGLAFVLALPPTPIVAPWQRRPAAPRFALDTPEGLMTIEATGAGIDQLTLDRRALTPPLESAALDRAELEAAFACLAPSDPPEGGWRVLLVGQLSPGRALAMEKLGAGTIDRTGAWHRVMALLERELFEGSPRPEGEVCPPAEASRRMALGEYDLVVVPSCPGDAPVLNLGFPIGPGGERPQATTVVVWLDTRAPVAPLELGAQVIPLTVDLEEFAVGVAYGGDLTHLASAGPASVRPREAGAPTARPDALDRLRMRKDDRLRQDRRELVRRLAGGNAGGPDGMLWGALAKLAAAQRRSSQFETPAQRVELPEEVLAQVREAALAEPQLDAFQRGVVETIAALLRAKRWVQQIDAILGPIAERHGPWTAIENVMAYADIELLDPETAVARMQRLVDVGLANGATYLMLGEAHSQAGDPVAASEAFWGALERAPEDRLVRRRLAIELCRAGDPAGDALVRDLLLEDPDDEELELYLGPGPFPAPPRGFPQGRLDTHAEH